MRRSLRYLAAAAGACVMGIVLIAGLGGEATSSSGAAVLPGTDSVVTTAAEQESVVTRQPAGTAETRSGHMPFPDVPGEFGDSNSGCFTPSREQREPRTNTWHAGGNREGDYLYVAVCAGGYEPQPRTGIFVAAYLVGLAGDQYFPRVFVPWSGPVTITDAPLGADGSAHVWDAHLGFEGTRGVTGYLDLADLTVHVTGGPEEGVCPFGTHGVPPECEISNAKFGRLQVKPVKRTTSPGLTVNYKVKINNIGRIEAEKVKLCVTDTSSEIQDEKRPIKGIRYGYPLCQNLGTLQVGETKSRVFHLKVRNTVKPGKKIELVFRARSLAPVGEPTDKQLKTILNIRHR